MALLGATWAVKAAGATSFLRCACWGWGRSANTAVRREINSSARWKLKNRGSVVCGVTPGVRHDDDVVASFEGKGGGEEGLDCE